MKIDLIKTRMLLLCGIWLLFTTLSMTVCEAGSDKDTLVYSWGVHAGEGNPHMYSPNQMYAQSMVYDALVKYGQGGKMEPSLAESWTISPDGKVYTFKLRPGVLFSDGTPFNAQAAKQNFETILANKSRHSWLESVNQLIKVEAPNELTLVLYLKNAYYPLLQELSLPRPFRFLAPSAFPASGKTSDGMKQPIGTGPWILAEIRKGEYDLFVRNEKYWGEKPKLKRVMVKVIPDPQTRVIALESGEIDLIYGGSGHGSGQISLESYEDMRQNAAYITGMSEPYSTRTMLISASSGPTRELAVRQAVLMAVNKDSIIRNIFLGVEPRAETLFSPNMPYSNLDLPLVKYDPAKAAALLDEHGWKLSSGQKIRIKNNESLSLVLSFVGNNALHKAIAEVVQNDLRSIGIEVKLIGEEPDAFNTRHMEGNFHMTFGDTWGAPYDPHSFCGSMRAPTHGDFQAQKGLPMKADLDAKIGAALISIDEAKRIALYKDILSTLHEQAIYLPLSYEPAVKVHNKNIQNVDFSLTSYDLPFDKIVKK